MTYYRNDYVRLTLTEPLLHDVYVVASDWPSMYDKHDPECWVVAVHDNEWTAIGSHVSTHYVDKHNPVVLYRDPENG